MVTKEQLNSQIEILKKEYIDNGKVLTDDDKKILNTNLSDAIKSAFKNQKGQITANIANDILYKVSYAYGDRKLLKHTINYLLESVKNKVNFISSKCCKRRNKEL